MWAIIIIVILVIFGVIIIKLASFYRKKHKKTEQSKYINKELNGFSTSKESYFKLIKKNPNIKTWNQLLLPKNLKEIKNTSGIYAIFIVRKNLNETIPIYVGQAKNIPSRWKQHQKELEKIIQNKSQARTYKKIVNFLSINKLKLEDLNFLVLKECEEKKLNQYEKKYINTFQSDIYGFNQKNGNK